MNANEYIGTLVMTAFEKLGHGNCVLSLNKDYWLLEWKDGPTKAELSKTIKAALPTGAPMLAVKLKRFYSNEFLDAVRRTAVFVTGNENYKDVYADSTGFSGCYSGLAKLLNSFIEDVDAALFMRYGPVNRANLMDQALTILQAPEEPDVEESEEDEPEEAIS